MNNRDKFPNQLVHHLLHGEHTHSRPIEIVETQNPVPSLLQGHGDVGSDKASNTGNEDGEANDEDGKGWSQKEKREGKRSTERERERERERDGEQPETRERKINKIINVSVIVTVHICTIIVVIVHLCTFLHPLMWVFFFFCQNI